MMKTTVTIGVTCEADIDSLAWQVQQLDYSFSVRTGRGYWNGASEESADFILVESDSAKIGHFVRLLVEWATGEHSLSNMNEHAVLVTQHEVRATLKFRPDWLDSLRSHYQYKSKQFPGIPESKEET